MVGVFSDSLAVMLLLVGSMIVIFWFVSSCAGINYFEGKWKVCHVLTYRGKL
jgi:hypothetical protein